MKTYVFRCLLLLIFFVVKVSGAGENSDVWPTIFWDPRNPIFGCNNNNYILKVPMYSQIYFTCPSIDNRFYDDSGQPFYENLYFLNENKTAFDNCDASKGDRMLYCNQYPSQRTNRHLVLKEPSGPRAPVFLPGKTYYYIGTGFRSLKRLNNVYGGSCNTTDNKGRNKLRLTLYVCTTEEEKKGECKICRSKGCYLKDCDVSCVSKSGNKTFHDGDVCFKLKESECTNYLLDTKYVKTERVNVSCPVTSPPTTIKTRTEDCVSKSDNKTFQDGDTCFKLNESECRNYLLDIKYIRTERVNVSCPTTLPPTNVTTNTTIKTQTQIEAQTCELDGSKVKILWVVIVGCCCAVLGAMLGVMGYKLYYDRRVLHKKKNNKINTQENRIGFVNTGFKKSLSDENGGLPPGEDCVYGIDEKGNKINGVF